MVAYRIAALCLPAAAAFLAPALWAWRPGWKAATAGHAALLLVATTWGLIAGASGAAMVAVPVVATAFAGFALGLHLAAGQVVSGLAVTLLCSTLFLAPPFVDDAANRNRSDLAQSRFDTLISVNPWAAIAASVFSLDILRDFQSIYRTHMADYVTARPPSWAALSAGYALAGIILGAASMGARRIRRPPPQSTINNPQSSP